jgi:N-acetylglucosaminyldiphosphoundecaprenol N-acetyl-beta-D-mannosaminyltransferase
MKRIDLLGCPVDAVDMPQTLEAVEACIRERRLCRHVVINVAKLVQVRKSPELRRVISSCDIINADGVPIVWASKILGSPLPGRVAGIDLFLDLVRLAAEKGYRPFFLGARREVVEKVVDLFRERYPSLQVAGWRDGYFREEEEETIVREISRSEADMLFAGFPSPRKELFLEKWMPAMKVPFAMGVGGSFDVVAGYTRRAPLWMQKAGLEWLFRLLQEPRKMWKRYATTNPVFVWIVFRELVSRWLPGRG